MTGSRPVLAVGGIRYETNSFAPPGRLDLTSLRTGRDVLDPLPSTEIAGAVRAAARRGVELLGLIDVFGGCGGPVDHDRYDELADDLVSRLSDGPAPDGVYLALHGAMTTSRTDAAEADLVRRVRAVVGAEVPVVASFDLHAAVDDELAELLDGIVGFKTCPHVDYEQTGESALSMLVDAVTGPPIAVRRVAVPMITAAEAHDTDDGPLASHMAAALERRSADVVDVSIFAVQPWLDTDRTTWSVTATHRVPDGASPAEDAADEVRAALLADVTSFTVVKTAPHDVPPLIRAGVDRPLLLADSGDSPSAGATGASTDLLGHLVDAGDARVLATVTDPIAACHLAGVPVGSAESVVLGGVPSLGIPPLELDVVVRSVHDGRFHRAYPAAEVDAGACVVVTHRNLTVVVTEHPVFMLDTSVFDHVGIDPAEFDAVQVKSAGGFRALWSPISTDSVAVGTRGASTSELATLPFAAAPVEHFVLP
jgi:microcystin degradation protein MlrC